FATDIGPQIRTPGSKTELGAPGRTEHRTAGQERPCATACAISVLVSRRSQSTPHFSSYCISNRTKEMQHVQRIQRICDEGECSGFGCRRDYRRRFWKNCCVTCG